MIYCTNCGTPQEAGSSFCTGCGTQIGAAASDPAVGPYLPSVAPAPPPYFRQRRWLMAAVAAVAALVLVLGAGVAAWAVLGRGADPPVPPSAAAPGAAPGETQAPASPPVPGDPSAQNEASRSASVSLQNASASALCISATGHDAEDNIFSYEPEKAIDGQPDTAWRCDGDGVGQRLEISFPNRVVLTSIGIIPGYAKTDPYDDSDRYAQNRRISAVQYTFDDERTVSQNFDTSTSHRSLQTIALPNISTSHVTITILSSVSGEVTRGQPPYHKVAISEVAVSTR